MDNEPVEDLAARGKAIIASQQQDTEIDKKLWRVGRAAFTWAMFAIAIAFVGFTIYGLQKQDQVNTLQDQLACRSALATNTDVGQAEVLDNLANIVDRLSGGEPISAEDRTSLREARTLLRAAKEQREQTATLCANPRP